VATEKIGAITDHGGAVDRAMARFGAGSDWLDLSTGINPWSYPVPPVPARAWQALPDLAALDRLKRAARLCYGAPVSAPVAAAPGSQALIQLLPRLLQPARIAVVGPTYAEHELCWRLAGHRVSVVSTPDEAMATAASVLVVVNPNNPDGRRFEPLVLADLAETMAARGGLLVIDEAFADVAPEVSLVPEAGRPGLVILRSFGKFFGLAGLRLGFGFGQADLIERLEAALGPWAVAGPAIEIGAKGLADRAWIAAMRTRLTAAASSLDALLSAHGLEPLGGTDLYRLVRTGRAAAIHDALGRQHILVRNFTAYPDRLRFGLPADEAASARLDRALVLRA